MDARTKRLINQLRFRQLALICSLAESRSLRVTAEQMHLTPPAVSSNVIDVEGLLGFQLFDRLPQGMRVTAAGENFVRTARSILDELGHSLTDQETPGRGPGWALRLGTPSFMGGFVLPALSRHLIKHGLGLRIRHEEGRVFALVERLYQGELDMVIVLGSTLSLTGLSHPSLESEPLYEERFVVVGSPARHASLPAVVPWADLIHQPWILPPPEFMQRALVDGLLLQQGLLPPEPIMQTPSQLAAIELAADDVGITALPLATVTPALNEGRLKILATDPDLPRMPVELAYRRSITARPGFSRLKDAIRACFISD